MEISLRDNLGYQVLSVLEAPNAWTASTFPPSCRAHAIRGADEDLAREEAWIKLSGVQLDQSKFTVIVPIHNEAAGLENFLGSLMYLRLPVSVPAQFVFVTNACSDASAEMIKSTLKRLKNYEVIDRQFKSDPGASPLVARAENGNISFFHVDTPTRGKSNALNLGNELALAAKHRVAICVDADVWLEPDALAHVAGEALRNFDGNFASPTIVSGSPGWVIRGSPSHLMANILARRAQRAPKPCPWRVCGPLMAWDTEWVHKMGGIPACKLEDYALGVVSRREGRSILQSEGKVWQFMPITIRDEARQMRRFVHGALQILARFAGDEEVAQLIKEELTYMRPLREHVHMRLNQIRERPFSAPMQFAKFLYLETIKFLGRMDYKLSPGETSWQALPTTKIRGLSLARTSSSGSLASS